MEQVGMGQTFHLLGRGSRARIQRLWLGCSLSPQPTFCFYWSPMSLPVCSLVGPSPTLSG